MERCAGVLLPIPALPGAYGIGTFGKEARLFARKIAEAGFKIWQILPFGIPDHYGSPYASVSAFAGNPLLIDPEQLARQGLLTDAELAGAVRHERFAVDYARLWQERMPLLRTAAGRVSDAGSYVAQIEAHPRLASFCRFMAQRTEEEGYDLFFWQFVQAEFLRQWLNLKDYVNRLGIAVVGDMPIYVSAGSADVWESPHLYDLDATGHPLHVAGVPPDYFSADGQLWGNPLYNWDAMRADGYDWWRQRLEHAFLLFDGVRIDHFRAFASYWQVPAGARTAREGKWVKGPGRKLIDLIRATAAGRLVIAEDLGEFGADVEKLLDYSGFPGMRVLQFGFDGADQNRHVPYAWPRNTVAYTGTHDNDTLLGFMAGNDAVRRTAFDYAGYGGDDWRTGCAALIRVALASCAECCILPVQDLLFYGTDTRMNTPGRAEGNWSFRLTEEGLASLDTDFFLQMNRLYGRWRPEAGKEAGTCAD